MSSNDDASDYSSGGSQPGSAAAAFHTAAAPHADSGGQSVSLAPPAWAVRRFGPPRSAAGFADAEDDEVQHGSAQIDTVESLRESSVVIRPGGGAPLLEDDAATGASPGFGFAAMAAPGLHPATASHEQQYAAAEAAAAAYREKRNPEAGAPPLPLGSGASLATSSSWVSTDISGLSQQQHQQYAAGAGSAAGVAGGQPFCPPMAASMHRFGAPPQQEQVWSTNCKPRRPLPNLLFAATVTCLRCAGSVSRHALPPPLIHRP